MLKFFKIGNTAPGDSRRWLDGQLVTIRPSGFPIGKRERKAFLIIEDGLDYDKVRGDTLSKQLEFKKQTTVPDINGKYPWEFGYLEHNKQERKRDYFCDFKYLLDQKYIDRAVFDRIYDKKADCETIYLDRDPSTYLFHELDKTRLESDYSNVKGSIAEDGLGSGTDGGFTIGADGDYTTVELFEADIALELTGDLHMLHLDEQSEATNAVDFEVDTNTYTLYLTAESGCKHNGTFGSAVHASGDGARIHLVHYDYIAIHDTNVVDAVISDLVMDAQGTGNRGLYAYHSGSGGAIIVERNVVKGDASTSLGICHYATTILCHIRNNIIYGGFGQGIQFYTNAFNARTIYIYNNTVIGAVAGIRNDATGAHASTVLVVKNNLVQDCTNSFVDDGGGFGTTAKNITDDADGPDAAYDNTDVHTNSVFKNYANNDYRLDSGGDAPNLAIVDDGEDLSGTFTDDIEDQTRDTWYIGASEIVAAVGETLLINVHDCADTIETLY